MQIVSTYRVQFHKGFTFRDATAIVPYLHELGITHVYASPYLKAVAGSTHGYDVIDQSQLNPEVGSPADYEKWVETLSDHGMSHILDSVPNHMGVETNDNPWWNDVLAHGRKSKFANFFDINWERFSPRPELVGKVLLPVLGEPYAEAVSKGVIQLKQEAGQRFVTCYDREFPIDPNSKMTEDLSELLDLQHYRLAFWRVAADEINYRRFFDISGLAGLQMQRQEVFDAVHAFTFELIAAGKVAGLRIDHPDGLLDPEQYFERLQEKFKSSCPQDGKPLWVSVEKILNGDEALCEQWNVAGTSGYDFLCRVNDLFIDSANESAMTDVYTRFINDSTSYADWVHRAKCFVLDHAMFSEMVSLTSRLDALAQLSITSRDFTRRQLHEALREVIACFPVYRSYVSSRGVSVSDEAVVEQAVKQASERNSEVDSSTLKFICDSVLLRYPIPASAREAQLDFAQRFQQFTSPVNAKGIEDSTFYIFNRLISLNEVGGDPDRFGRSADSLHEYFSHRRRDWALALSTLSTHDTKRSEDVRARLNVLCEIPDQWDGHLQSWNQAANHLETSVHPNDRYLLFQTLLGAWPLAPMDAAETKSFANRIIAYMQKALREAKLRSNWVAPNKEYESAMTSLIEKLVDPEIGMEFLADFLPFQNQIGRLGLLNSLSQTIIRLTAPGICDTYQGTELWDFSLVDPDNRRPVDYPRRMELLNAVTNEKEMSPLLDTMQDGRAKLRVIQRLLHLRRRLPNLFLEGSYQPLAVSGSLASHLFAFARKTGDQFLIVIAPRLMASLVMDRPWSEIDWGDTRVNIPSDLGSKQYVEVITDSPFVPADDRMLTCSTLLAEIPFAVLLRTVPGSSQN